MVARRDDGAHAVTYELGWRKLADPSRHASRAVRQQAGHNLKSSVAYTYRFDSFADPMLPYDGFGFRCGDRSPALTLGTCVALLCEGAEDGRSQNFHIQGPWQRISTV